MKKTLLILLAVCLVADCYIRRRFNDVLNAAEKQVAPLVKAIKQPQKTKKQPKKTAATSRYKLQKKSN